MSETPEERPEAEYGLGGGVTWSLSGRGRTRSGIAARFPQAQADADAEDEEEDEEGEETPLTWVPSDDGWASAQPSGRVIGQGDRWWAHSLW